MGTAESAGPVRVASVPRGHVYVRHLADPDRLPGTDPEGVVRLADPDPDDPGREAGERWWPPAMLEPEWAWGAEMDVYHLNFGFDARTPRQLAQLLRVLRTRRIPFVHTVHDLRNPHHVDRRAHDEHLDVLVPAADAVLTLTQGAADEVARRWGRTAVVVPHPHVVEPAVVADLRGRPRDPDTFRIGVHVKSLRASMDPAAILPTLVDVVADLPGAVLQVNGHRDVLERGGARYDERLARYLEAAAGRGDLELVVHDFLDDAALWVHLSSLDLSVLPYRFGTHSGWLEACRDLGTTVLAPTCGYLQEQGPVLTWGMDEDHDDLEGLERAVRRAHRDRPDLGADPVARTDQRRRLAAFHDRLYRALLGGETPPTSIGPAT